MTANARAVGRSKRSKPRETRSARTELDRKLTYDEEAKNPQRPDRFLIEDLLKAMDVCRRREATSIEAIERIILMSMEPRVLYSEHDAAAAFGMSLEEFLAKAKSVGLEVWYREWGQGVRLYVWHELIPHLKSHWRERVERGW